MLPTRDDERTGRPTAVPSAVDGAGELQRTNPAVPHEEDHTRVAEDEHDGPEPTVPGLAEEPPGDTREDDTGDHDREQEQFVPREEAARLVRAVDAVSHTERLGRTHLNLSVPPPVRDSFVDRPPRRGMSGRTLAYRAVPNDDEHRPVYRRLLQYAFAPERGPDWDDDPHEQPAEFEPRGLYEPSSGVGDTAETDTETETPTASARPREATDVAPGGLVVASALVDFRMRIRGAFRPVGGVTAVASPPERRRRGHVGTLLDHMHEELRGREVAVAALWPFSHAFYRRFDYGRTNDYVQFEFAPDALDSAAATPDEDGPFRRLAADDPADVEALTDLHERSAPEPLALDRSPDWWRHRVFRTWTGERFVYGWGDTDDQELRAYLVYGFEEDDPGRTLAVTYWGAADDEAYRQLLTFLRNHDSQVSQVRLFAGDTSLLDRLSDPADDVTTTVKPGPMVRVVDVEGALSRLVTPATDERVVLSVRDPRYDWNDSRFELSVDDGLTTCRRVDADGNVDVDIDIDISALSRVLVGTRPTAVLARLGHVAGDADAVAQLDSLLPVESPAPYLREWF